jgi:hypothetical protein
VAGTQLKDKGNLFSLLGKCLPQWSLSIALMLMVVATWALAPKGFGGVEKEAHKSSAKWLFGLMCNVAYQTANMIIQLDDAWEVRWPRPSNYAAEVTPLPLRGGVVNFQPLLTGPSCHTHRH